MVRRRVPSVVSQSSNFFVRRCANKIAGRKARSEDSAEAEGDGVANKKVKTEETDAEAEGGETIVESEFN